ncbi:MULTISPECIES: hypothetical protein [unclassified Paenibacillus]|uniref:hypothetical protein n=1 Tax=unclassified Paenibacillus TaxID=185978 RepID=UPI002407768C|nr:MULTISPECIES: hypothetical protein [unclassified Paenibacillus]MDF9845165.1 hypothetical protein [Paenibacillus sp. PastF-2]MDF9850343.1 hypothetical protein [Paenibacillus sp. PastM-2]MDF9856954.1 hypothetical protein [Paenibacillus sp. PastF-1]MDH6482189.1 hypothetical protein [Paenibacillus sp. PastH-2]MDH6509647.1 hypothetical protein [Paenibacillus sp. PastM-3]
MALQKNLMSSTGMEVPNAYIKIDSYQSDSQNNVSARIRAYVSKELEIEGKAPIEGTEDVILMQAEYSEESVNAKRQIYNYMKTLGKYSDAIDA